MSGGKKSPQSEAEVQKQCWAWLGTRQCVPENVLSKPLQDFSYMVPNGTQLAGGRTRRAQYMSSLKAQGFRPGVSDIVIAYPLWGTVAGHCIYAGAYIELKKDASSYGGPKAIKSRRTAVRPEQRDWLELMSDAGYWASIAWGFEDFKLLVNSFLRGESPPPLDWDERK